MTYVVALTGGIGSGKSVVTGLFAARGITIVDADVAARLVVEPGRPALAAIARHCGRRILQADGTLDRAALRRRVFADPAERRWLEALTHPLIAEEIAAQLRTAASPYVILVSPLLLETRQRDLADVIVVVDVPEEVQVARTMARDANDEAEVRRIMAAQMGRRQRLEFADIVIDNTRPLDDLEEVVDELHREFLARAEHSR